MKAWHVQDKDGEYQQIVFADKRSEAISKSEALGWDEYINVRARRASFADDLEKEPSKLVEAQLEDGWWFECYGEQCFKEITFEDEHCIVDGRIYCGKCSV
ncbi:hypothetical protein [Guptibacillus spartinae]|uniref:hypothetical protein n=1 Tax=Guptibacillus spartinae TaxID=3025679 RepID=UPI0023602CF4|nr:hypothetical protein [Pseudalkalibacillus spartinae]